MRGFEGGWILFCLLRQCVIGFLNFLLFIACDFENFAGVYIRLKLQA